MSDQAAGHDAFDELAAGHALHALEPADEQAFLRHAAGCPRCLRSMTEFQDVAAALAETAPAALPGEQLGDRILAAARADVAAGAVPRTGVVQLLPRRRDLRPPREGRWLRRAAAAAAAAAVVAGGIWGGLAATGSGPVPPPSGCAHVRGCSEVILTAAHSHAVAGKVIVQNGQVWLVPGRIAPDDPADQIYVLWQITGAHTPLPVGSFDVRPGTHAPVRIGGLAAPYSATWAFAISLEHGRIIPATPSHAVALGQVS